MRPKTSGSVPPDVSHASTAWLASVPAAWWPRRGSRCPRRLGQALSCQLRLTPSRVVFGVANLAPPVTSGSALCVRVGRKGGSEGVAGAGGRARRPCSRPTFKSPGCAWPVAKAADAPRAGSRWRLAEFSRRRSSPPVGCGSRGRDLQARPGRGSPLSVSPCGARSTARRSDRRV
jgi:hypothetical protein